MSNTGLILLVFLLGVAVLFLARRGRRRTAPTRRKKQIAVDGTNVLFWKDEVARLPTLKRVVSRLQREGFDPVVFLDASSRHHLGDKSLNETKFAEQLGLPAKRIMVCPARTEADAFILEYAGLQNIAVVSNDRFRDRPQEARNIRLVKGRFQGDKLILKNL